MRVLVTGGAGFIGSHTVDLLLSKGYEVRVLDNLLPPVHPLRVKPDYLPDDVEFIIGDVRNQNDMEKSLRGVNMVFHLAAYQGYLPDFSTFASVNDGGTALLYEIIVREKLPVEKVVIASSQAVYGEGKYQCPRHGIQYPPTRTLDQLQRREWEIKCPVCHDLMKVVPTDEAKVNTHNQYSISKYSQELYGLTLGKRFGIPTAALRYSITQGPRQSFHNAYSGILRIFVLRLLNKLRPIIYEDGAQLRDYVYIGDVAAANVLTMENDETNYDVFNVGGSEVLSVSEYSAMVTKVMRSTISHEALGQFRFGDVRHIISDTSKLRGLGWEPKVSLEQIIKEYVNWASQQPDTVDAYTDAEKVMIKEGVIRITG